jgi:hypothetical protein
MKKSEVAKILTYLMADYGEVVTPEKIDLWADQLKDVGAEEGWDTARLLAASHTYGKPRCPDFHKALAELRRSRDPEAMTAEAAFRLVMQLAETMGRTKSGEVKEIIKGVSSVAYEATIYIGFMRFCDCTSESEPFLLRDFKTVFEELESRKNSCQKISGILNLNAGPERKKLENPTLRVERIQKETLSNVLDMIIKK